MAAKKDAALEEPHRTDDQEQEEEKQPSKPSAIVKAKQADDTPEAEQHIHPNVLDYEMEVPVTAPEPFVRVKAISNHSCFIGDRDWTFKKDEIVRVPRSVANELARAKKIHAGFY